jgi:hypothetical protein
MLAGIHATQNHTVQPTAESTTNSGPILVNLECEIWGVGTNSMTGSDASTATLVATLATDIPGQPITVQRSVQVAGPGPHWVSLQAGTMDPRLLII